MSVVDDRADFEKSKIENSKALGKDHQVFRQATETVVSLDAYNYSYLWNWMGAPIIQMPSDIMATQEIIWATKPDIIIETGVARGGSVLFMASLLELIGNGKVIGVDVDIREHNRQTIEDHPMSARVQLIEGSSIEPKTLEAVTASIPPHSRVMVVLDSDHSRDHVLAELRAYGLMVTKGCYMVVADTLVGHLSAEQTPKKRSQVLYQGNDPLSARNEYLKESNRFEVDEALNGKLVLSSSPGGYLLCVE